MTSDEALRFVREHGLVTESSSGPVPSLAGAVAGRSVHGSWWSHPKAQEIFRLTRALRRCDEILVCRLVGGKVTYVHQRLWPHLVVLAAELDHRRLAQIREIHTRSGKHVVREVPFPKWVPAAALVTARAVTEHEARTALGAVLSRGRHHQRATRG